MRRRRIAGLVLALGLVSGIATLAQRPDREEPSPILPPPIHSDVNTLPQPEYAQPADVPNPTRESRPPARTRSSRLPAPTTRTEPTRSEDPLQAVDAFMEKSREQAEASIKTLTAEAEALRSQLRKVEAAIAKWETVAQALGSDLKPSSRRALHPTQSRPEPRPRQQVEETSLELPPPVNVELPPSAPADLPPPVSPR